MREREAVAEGEELLGVELLLLVRGHAPLPRRAHAVALLGLGEDHGGLALVARGVPVGREDLHGIVAAAAQAIDVVVREVRHELLQLRILVEEVLAVEGAVGGRVGLELAVHRLEEALLQPLVHVAREERVPVGGPEQLDHVPARAGEEALQLLHDGAVAAHRAVEALQVAVDDEHEVVELLARGDRETRERLGLVHLAVAHEAPHLARRASRGEPALLEVAHEARLVDREERADAHGARGELPQVRHQPRMRIRRQALAARLAPVVVEVLLVEPALEEGARIDARRRMRLEVDEVAVLAAAEEVVEAHLEEVRGRRVARDVAAQLAARAIGAHHHRERVPAHQGRDARLDVQVALVRRLLGEPDGVHVRRGEHLRQRHAARARVLQQAAQQEGGALGALGLDQRIERLDPLAGLERVGVGIVGVADLAGNGRVHSPDYPR